MGISFVRLNRKENRHSLAIFDRKEIARGLKNRGFAGVGVVKIATATAENRAILVHSAL